MTTTATQTVRLFDKSGSPAVVNASDAAEYRALGYTDAPTKAEPVTPKAPVKPLVDKGSDPADDAAPAKGLTGKAK